MLVIQLLLFAVLIIRLFGVPSVRSAWLKIATVIEISFIIFLIGYFILTGIMENESFESAFWLQKAVLSISIAVISVLAGIIFLLTLVTRNNTFKKTDSQFFEKLQIWRSEMEQLAILICILIGYTVLQQGSETLSIASAWETLLLIVNGILLFIYLDIQLPKETGIAKRSSLDVLLKSIHLLTYLNALVVTVTLDNVGYSIAPVFFLHTLVIASLFKIRERLIGPARKYQLYRDIVEVLRPINIWDKKDPHQSLDFGQKASNQPRNASESLINLSLLKRKVLTPDE